MVPTRWKDWCAAAVDAVYASWRPAATPWSSWGCRWEGPSACGWPSTIPRWRRSSLVNPLVTPPDMATTDVHRGDDRRRRRGRARHRLGHRPGGLGRVGLPRAAPPGRAVALRRRRGGRGPARHGHLPGARSSRARRTTSSTPSRATCSSSGSRDRSSRSSWSGASTWPRSTTTRTRSRRAPWSSSPACCPSRRVSGRTRRPGPRAALSREDVVHVAHLARLDLTRRGGRALHGAAAHGARPRGRRRRARPLPPGALVAPDCRCDNVLRPDEPRPSLDRDEVLAAAPVGRGPPLPGAAYRRGGAVTTRRGVAMAADVRTGAPAGPGRHRGGAGRRSPPTTSEFHAFLHVLDDEARGPGRRGRRRGGAGTRPGAAGRACRSR